MGFLKRLFSKKLITKVELIDHTDGINEDDRLDNLIIGDMVGGFDGMFMAELYNTEESAETTFKVTYDDGTSEIIITQDGNSEYNYYIQFVE